MSVQKEHQMPYRVVMPASNTGRMNVLLRWWQSAVQNWQRRKMIAALEALDDRTLMDIGVHRGGIKGVVDGFNDAELRMVPIAPEPKHQDASYADLRRAA